MFGQYKSARIRMQIAQQQACQARTVQLRGQDCLCCRLPATSQQTPQPSVWTPGWRMSSHPGYSLLCLPTQAPAHLGCLPCHDHAGWHLISTGWAPVGEVPGTAVLCLIHAQGAQVARLIHLLVCLPIGLASNGAQLAPTMHVLGLGDHRAQLDNDQWAGLAPQAGLVCRP